MEFSRELTNEIQTRLDMAKEFYPAALSDDQRSLLVDGGIGYGCFVSPEGDLFIETYDVGSEEPPKIDRSRAAQIAVIISGSRTLPQLAELLPKRPPAAPGCSKCNGTGRLQNSMPDFPRFICDECSGLGWIEM